MARLERLETNVAAMAGDVADLKPDVADLKVAAWKTAEILADHSERLSGLQRALDDGFGHANQQLGDVKLQLGDMKLQLGGVNDRLDRLISVTIQERTAGVERLGDIERRLAKLEERVGV